MKPEHFDIAVIIPLEEELREFMQIFPSIKNLSTSTEFLHVVDTGNTSIQMLVAQQEDMGKSNALQTASKLLDKYEINMLVCLGIGGSISSDMRLGDVCYSGTIIDVYDNSKTIDHDGGGLDIELSPTQYSTPRDILNAINFMRTQPDLQISYESWQNEREAAAVILVPDTIIGRNNQQEKIGKPQTKNGTIVCGAVSKSETYNKKLHALDRKILAIETESGGIFSEALSRQTAALTIRGISDYADQSKSNLEVKSDGKIRRLAASNAVSFLRLQMQNHYFIDALKRLDKGQQTELKLVQEPVLPKAISKILNDIGQMIDDKLRELSPEFRLQPKGYRLPIPRVKLIEQDSLGKRSSSSPKEIRNIIQERQMALINLPRTYPDQSLPWIIADDLMAVDINGKQVIPVVVNGEAIKPPRSTFEAISQQPISEFLTIPGAQVVIIIDTVPLNSKTRLNHLIEQIKIFENVKFVFITRGDVNLVFESEFSNKLPLYVYDVCEISFAEISHFIQKNFSMNGSEAEVIALRLRETFHKFSLSAHPTYFAGIPKETLSALLHANRRAELIQLAVDGFLTFVVAGDKADVTLSRTTRSRFLRRLVAAMKIEKHIFDHAGIIKFTVDFSKEYDFDIEPLAFIQGFIDKGILHFDNEILRFSLPFIESYLLAIELASTPDMAIRYFDLNNPDMDYGAFDLYAEVGAANEIIKKVVDQLEKSISTLSAAAAGRTHILLTDEIQPTMLGKQERLSALQDRVRKTADDIHKGRNDNAQKQKLLDIVDRVRETTAKQVRTVSDKDKSEDTDVKQLGAAVQNWSIGVLMLGSGAEHLDAQTKRYIATSLTSLASLILDEWTRLQMKIDFESVKSELTSEEMLQSFHSQRVDEKDIEETRKLIINLVDILEYSILASPFLRISAMLCEQARHRVLATSVENSQASSIMERLIRGSWLADIDSKRGHSDLKAVVKELPTALFLRITLASHYLSRVYWNHWKQEDRLVLLEVAEDTLKSISLGFDKSGLKRMIERKEGIDKDEVDSVPA